MYTEHSGMIELFPEVYKQQTPGAEDYTANLLGVNALHQGIEFDFTYKPSNDLNFSGMLSLGDWKWDNNLEDVPVFNENQEEVDNTFFTN